MIPDDPRDSHYSLIIDNTCHVVVMKKCPDTLTGLPRAQEASPRETASARL
jgi:hypothetical protein